MKIEKIRANIGTCKTVVLGALVNYLSLQISTIKDPEVREYFVSQTADCTEPEELYLIAKLVCCAVRKEFEYTTSNSSYAV